VAQYGTLDAIQPFGELIMDPKINALVEAAFKALAVLRRPPLTSGCSCCVEAQRVLHATVGNELATALSEIRRKP
jgi:hypothetical protein